MRIVVFSVLGVALFGGWRGSAALAAEGSELRIIVDPSNPTVTATREAIADAFLKTSTRWPDGETIRPVDQRTDSPARKAFSAIVLKRSIAAIRSYWQQRIFSGRGVPPLELDSDDAVVRYVSEHRGAVGYVSASAQTGNTKVVTVR
jgi:ABC-type phosphate transport system substrate-binding protein